MLENWAILAFYAILAFCGSVIGGFVARFMFEQISLISLERRIRSLELAYLAGRANNVRVEKSERMGAAMAEAALLIKEGKKPEELPALLLPKYPDIAMDLIKKGMKGKLDGLI